MNISTRTDVFEVIGCMMLPGYDWERAVNRARRVERRGNGEDGVFALGISLGGFASAYDGVMVDLVQFAEAAVPPLKRHEIADLVNGYNQASSLLLTIDAQLSPRVVIEEVNHV